MVSCNLIGRMANQMFQISCCIAYALRHGMEYHIPAHTMNDSVWKPMFTHLENPNWDNKISSLTIKEGKHSYEKIPAPNKFHFDFDISSISGDEINWIIDGYRQSLKYFEDYLPEVRKAFGFTYTPIYGLTSCIHIRRGDYLNFPDKHPVVNEDYLIKAVLKMLSNKVVNFRVFSDDIKWCKDFFNNSDLSKLANFIYSEGKTELEDFQEMLYCPNFIISNSTYSLMAAILSENPNKIVISPDETNWFGDGNLHLDVSDLIPKEYIRIKY